MSRKKKKNSFNPALTKPVLLKKYYFPVVNESTVQPTKIQGYRDELIKDEERHIINYSPFITGVSVDFTGFRFKQNHVIKLKTGEITRARPNADAWYLEDGRTVYDPEVAKISLIPDGLDQRFSFTGEDRIVRDIEMFGVRYPVYCGETFYYPSQIPEDKKLVILGAWAYKYKSGEKFKIIPVTGMIVSEDDPRPGIDELMKYEQADVDLFWCDEKCRLFNNEELIVRIRQYKALMKIKEHQPEAYAKAEQLVIKHEIPRNKWTRYLGYFTEHTEDKVMECYNLVEGTSAKLDGIPSPFATAAKSQRSPYIMANHAYMQGKIFENI